ncbi:hypothetical protein V5799_003429 [Amblyomma americanum]|uniref:ESCRT-I complex subunit MVB12A n=1 Tax=Amblyomma americanum TaxID=6943 RepID=A0AAQ4D8Z2_AMBAM
MMQDLLKVLPDDLPITDVCIIEDPQNCPPGYHVVDKTFDQDTDADLWKDRFFGRRITRYICYSKAHHTECIQSLLVVGDKEVPPEGHIVMNSTKDTDQRAMKKKLLCYKMVARDSAGEAVSDIIVLSKSRKPPDGFVLAGEINSLHIGYKLTSVAPVNGRKNSYHQPPLPPLPYPLPSHVDDHLQKKSPGGRVCQRGKSMQKSAIDDVPFEVNPKYRAMFRLSEFTMPNIRIKTANEIFEEYNYNFQVENQAQQT